MESSTSITRFALVVAVVCGALLQVVGASAQDCKADGECAKGYTCQVVGGSACAGAACPPGVPCPPPPPCDPVEIKACRPGPCTADSDCAEGMVCFSQAYTQCPPSVQVDCPPNAACKVPAAQPCANKIEQSCVPKYVPPCKADADCGDGFTCVEQTLTSCSAGSGSAGGSTPGSPGGTPVPPVPSPTPIVPTCTVESTGTFYCEPKEITCTKDIECPSMWTCGENPSAPVCTDASPPAPAPSGGCSGALPAICKVCADGSCASPNCANGSWEFVCKGDSSGTAGAGSTPTPPPSTCSTPNPAPSRLCQPPFSNLGFGGAGGFGESAGGTTDSAVPPGAAMGTKSSSPTPASNSGTTGADHTQNSANSSGSSMPTHVKACSVTTPGSRHETSGGAALLAAFGLGLIGLRRRQSV